jgi:hypothetical protein
MAEPGLPGRTDPPRYTAGNLARESETRQGLADIHTGKLSADRTDSTVALQSGDSFGMGDEQDRHRRQATTMERKVKALRTACPKPSLLKYAYTSSPALSHSPIRSAHQRRSLSLYEPAYICRSSGPCSRT